MFFGIHFALKTSNNPINNWVIIFYRKWSALVMRLLLKLYSMYKCVWKDSLRPRPRVSNYWKQIFSALAFRPQYFHRFNVFICGCCLIFMLWVLFKILKRPWLSSYYVYRHYSWAIDDCRSTYFRSQILWPCYSVWRYHWPLCYVQSRCCWSLCVSRMNE